MLQFLTLLTAAGASTSGSAVNPQIDSDTRTGIVQIDRTGAFTGNIVIEGRMDSNYPWATIATIANPNVSATVDLFPNMRATTGTGTGTVTKAVLMVP